MSDAYEPGTVAVVTGHLGGTYIKVTARGFRRDMAGWCLQGGGFIYDEHVVSVRPLVVLDAGHSKTFIDLNSRWLRVIATCLYVLAALAFATALLGLGRVLLTDGGPDWNIAQKFGEAASWFYVGALHSLIARLREAS